MRTVPISTWLLVCLFACGCVYGDLDVYQKRCSRDHPCPPGYLCVERPLSLTGNEGRCHTPADAPPCPDPRFCSQNREWVERCLADGFSSTVAEDCLADGLECNPDTARCASACGSDDDCAPGTCDTGTGLCREMPDCNSSPCPDDQICIAGIACVSSPADEAVTASGTPDLADCRPPQPGGGPSTCDLTGRVNFFPLTPTGETVGLSVILRPAGDPQTRIQEVEVVADEVDSGYGHYRFTEIETDRVYDVEIEAREVVDAGDSTVTTIHAGIGIRADRVEDGLFSRALSAMRVSDFRIYGTDLFPGIESHRSLVIGRVTDCHTSNPVSLGNATVGLAIEPAAPGRIYYFKEDVNALVPDGSGQFQATSTKGYYGAAGVPACQNRVAFAAREGSSVFPLGSVGFVAKPGSAVIANMPAPANRLAE